MSYAYDKRLRFGLLHHFSGNDWIADAPLNEELSSRFEKLFGAVQRRDPLKYASLKELYTYISQPVPRISNEKLHLAEGGSEDDYLNAFLLSRIANLPLNRTYRNYSVSDWIRSMLNSYYRTHNILIPNPEELKLGDTRKMVTGALAIGPEPGTYFNMHVLGLRISLPGLYRCLQPLIRDNPMRSSRMSEKSGTGPTEYSRVYEAAWHLFRLSGCPS